MKIQSVFRVDQSQSLHQVIENLSWGNFRKELDEINLIKEQLRMKVVSVESKTDDPEFLKTLHKFEESYNKINSSINLQQEKGSSSKGEHFEKLSQSPEETQPKEEGFQEIDELNWTKKEDSSKNPNFSFQENKEHLFKRKTEVKEQLWDDNIFEEPQQKAPQQIEERGSWLEEGSCSFEKKEESFQVKV